MTPAEIRKIRQATAKAWLAVHDVYDKEVPEEFQCDETFEFFYACLLGDIANAFDRWKYEELRELNFTDEEEKEGD